MGVRAATLDEEAPARSTWPARAIAALRGEPLLLVIPVWVVASLLWVRADRWTRYAELDEAAYLGMTARLAHPGWAHRRSVLATEGVHGPLQALLGAPLMAVTQPDLRVLLAINILAVAVAAAATAGITRRVADRSAGTVAGVLVLLSPTVAEFSHTALTAVLPMAGAALALWCLARGDGLARPGWAAAAGIAIGTMVLGRSMAIGFVPSMALAGLGWAWSCRTPWPKVLRHGALVAASALATAGWWWWVRWDAVSDYLFGGGSSDTDRISDPVGKVHVHLIELRDAIGPAARVTIVAMAVLAIVHRAWRRTNDTDGAPTPLRAAGEAGPLATWPLWLSAAAGIAVLGMSSAPGVGFTLSLVPATVAAGIAALRRLARTRRSWRVAAGTVVGVALISVLIIPGTGLRLRSVWGCGQVDDRVLVQCGIDTNAEGREWRHVSEAVSDRIARLDAVIDDPFASEPESVAMTPRDNGVSYNSVGLALQLRHDIGRDLTVHFRPDDTQEEQISRAVEEALLLVAVEDAPVEPRLGQHAPPVDEVVDAARAAGFRDCEVLPTPDDRQVWILVAPSVPDEVCLPRPAAG